MGYALAIAPCFGCNRPFGFNPIKVPSIRDANGVRQPVCLTCVEMVNPTRVKNGLEPIVPHPDAYTGCDENELPVDD